MSDLRSAFESQLGVTSQRKAASTTSTYKNDGSPTIGPDRAWYCKRGISLAPFCVSSQPPSLPAQPVTLWPLDSHAGIQNQSLVPNPKPVPYPPPSPHLQIANNLNHFRSPLFRRRCERVQICPQSQCAARPEIEFTSDAHNVQSLVVPVPVAAERRIKIFEKCSQLPLRQRVVPVGGGR